MKKASRIILAAAILFTVYGYWGAFTNSGNKVYDEMDAMLPFFVLVFGCILFLVFFVLLLVITRKSGAGKVKKPEK